MSSRALPVINNRTFNPAQHYARANGEYSLLPLRFLPLDDDRYVATNLGGDHIVLDRTTLTDLVKHRLVVDTDAYDELKSRHFLIDADSNVALDLLATKLRTRHARLADLTSLFLFVVTLRCEHSCRYCQVSRVTEDRAAYDMTNAMADRALDIVFATPAQAVKIEFQGGEPLLNFDVVRYIVVEATHRNIAHQKTLAFVVTSNLALLTAAHLAFFAEHDVHLSTSLDGPQALHNRNRPRPGGDSHQRAISGIEHARTALGHDRVAALMTTTPASLDMPEAIVDEYVRHGFESIFLRSISPYGFASRSGLADACSASGWHAFYRRALDHIIALNIDGTVFREEFTALLVRRILTPFSTGYVDLQSPAGIGIGALVFNYDGDIYASDESRMLAEMGDKTFRLGSVFNATFEDVITSEKLLMPVLESMTEGVPMCSDCAFQPWCGADPVFHHARHGDVVGFKADSEFCDKHMSAFRHIVQLLEAGGAAARIIRSWVA